MRQSLPRGTEFEDDIGMFESSRVQNSSKGNLKVFNQPTSFDETVIGSEELLQVVKRTQPAHYAEQLLAQSRKHIHRRDKFHISTSRTFTKAQRKAIVKLFGETSTTAKSYDMRQQLGQNSLNPSLEAEAETTVPDFKKNCLIEFVKDNWSKQIHGKSQFESLCKFTNQLVVLSKDRNDSTRRS